MRGVRLGVAWLAVLALVPGLAAGVAVGQEKENPIIAQVKPKLKDANRPFTLIVLLKVKEGAAEQFEAAFAKAVKGTRQEKGYLAYDLNRDTQDPGRYMVYERWRSLRDLEDHVNAPHVTALLSEVGPLLEGAPEIRVLMPAGEERKDGVRP